MNVCLTEDEALLVDTVRSFARSELLEADRRCDVDGSLMYEMLPAVAEMGLMNLLVPEELGGLGCSMRVYAAIIEALAYASPSMAVMSPFMAPIRCRGLNSVPLPKRCSHWKPFFPLRGIWSLLTCLRE